MSGKLPNCCNCLTSHVLKFPELLAINGGEHLLVTSAVTAKVQGATVVIEGVQSYKHVQLHHLLEVDVYGEMAIPGARKGGHPLQGLPSTTAIPLTFNTTHNPPVMYLFNGDVIIDETHGRHRGPMDVQASGIVTVEVIQQGAAFQYQMIEFPALVVFNVVFSNATQGGGSSAPELPIPTSSPPERQRPGLTLSPGSTSSGKRKRSSAGDGVRCVVCLDPLDAILGSDRTLSIARCGHLLCSQCVLGLRKKQNCRSCKKALSGIRRLYGV